MSIRLKGATIEVGFWGLSWRCRDKDDGWNVPRISSALGSLSMLSMPAAVVGATMRDAEKKVSEQMSMVLKVGRVDGYRGKALPKLMRIRNRRNTTLLGSRRAHYSVVLECWIFFELHSAGCGEISSGQASSSSFLPLIARPTPSPLRTHG